MRTLALLCAAAPLAIVACDSAPTAPDDDGDNAPRHAVGSKGSASSGGSSGAAPSASASSSAPFAPAPHLPLPTIPGSTSATLDPLQLVVVTDPGDSSKQAYCASAKQG